MKPWTRTGRDERGVALPLALFALVMLTGLLLAFLTMAGMEPEISANLTEVARARYLADAGIEFAYAQLVSNMNWDQTLLGPDLKSGTSDDGLLANNQTLPAPLNNATFGTFTVRVRNDNQAGDPALTGQPIDGGVIGGNPTTDTNGVLILTATGAYRGISRQIQVVMRRVALPPFAGAYNVPGIQADVAFNNNQFEVDGRDYEYKCTKKCSDPDPLNRTYSYSVKSDQSKMKYGLAVAPGNQPNLSPAQTFEQRVESQLSGGKSGNIIGKDQTNPTGSAVKGLNTVAPDASLGSFITVTDPKYPGDPLAEQTIPKKVNDFLNQLASFSGTTVLQSKPTCAQSVGGVPVGIRMKGTSTANVVKLEGCLDQTLNLGTVDKPALVYFKGDLDKTSAFASVRTEGSKIKGAGILIVEDGDFRISNQFEWDGLVIVTGRYVTLVWESGSGGTIYGAAAAIETAKCESGGTGCPNPPSSTLWDTVFDSSGPVEIRFSQQNLDLVQSRLLLRMSTWREL